MQREPTRPMVGAWAGLSWSSRLQVSSSWQDPHHGEKSCAFCIRNAFLMLPTASTAVKRCSSPIAAPEQALHRAQTHSPWVARNPDVAISLGRGGLLRARRSHMEVEKRPAGFGPPGPALHEADVTTWLPLAGKCCVAGGRRPSPEKSPARANAAQSPTLRLLAWTDLARTSLYGRLVTLCNLSKNSSGGRRLAYQPLGGGID